MSMNHYVVVAVLLLAQGCSEPKCPMDLIQRGMVCRRCPEGSEKQGNNCVTDDGGVVVEPTTADEPIDDQDASANEPETTSQSFDAGDAAPDSAQPLLAVDANVSVAANANDGGIAIPSSVVDASASTSTDGGLEAGSNRMTGPCEGNPCGAGNACESRGETFACVCRATHWQVGDQRCVPKFAQVSTYASNTCARRTDGSVVCWGLAFGSTPKRIDGIANAVQVEQGGDHACALDTGYAIWCWGSNSYGQLGSGMSPTALYSSPRAVRVVNPPGAATFSAGGSYVCAVRNDRSIACWGSNLNGTLGNGSTTDEFAPVVVAAHELGQATSIATAVGHACALGEEGRVACWGSGGSGRLGRTNEGRSAVPLLVPAVSDALEISVGASISCVRRRDRSVSCWGLTLGADHSAAAVWSATPTPVAGLTDVAQVSLAKEFAAHGCARKIDNTVVCWGQNTSGGVLGTGAPDRSASPIPINNLQGVTGIAVGTHHVCALRSDGGIVCWGANDYGQLGDGSTIGSAIPVEVLRW